MSWAKAACSPVPAHGAGSAWKSFGLAHPSRLLADFQELRQDFAKHPVGQSAETGCIQQTMSAPVDNQSFPERGDCFVAPCWSLLATPAAFAGAMTNYDRGCHRKERIIARMPRKAAMAVKKALISIVSRVVTR